MAEIFRKGEIRICGKDKLIEEAKNRYDWAIRITDPGGDFRGRPAAQQWCFTFDDVVKETKNYVAPNGPVMSSIERVATDIISRRRSHPGALLIHCNGGICRSTATAIFVLMLAGWGMEKAVDHVFELVPDADPNQMMLRYIEDEFEVPLRTYTKHKVVENWE